MSAAVSNERRGMNSGPGERGRGGLPGARGRPGNLQYVQPQYRAATPLPGGGGGGAPLPPIMKQKKDENVDKESQVRKLSDVPHHLDENDSQARRTDDFEEGVQRHVKSFKVKKDDPFAEVPEDDDEEESADRIPPEAEPQKRETPAHEPVTSASTNPEEKVEDAETVPGEEREESREKKQESQAQAPPPPVAAPAAAPEKPKVEERAEPAAKQQQEPESPLKPKKSGCCVVQ